MRVLVTGCDGYLGSVLCPMLREAGHTVYGVDINRRTDARDMNAMCRHLIETDCVIPLAAVVGAPACVKDGYGANTINHFAIENMLSRLSRDQMVVFPATDSGYPPGEVDETSPMNPKSLYARTKYAAEQAVLDHGGVSLRLASVFGVSPSMRDDLIVNDFVRHAAARCSLRVYEPDFRRNFVHIRDVASAFIHAIEHYWQETYGEAYNVGSVSATKRDLCEIIDATVGLKWSETGNEVDPDRRDNIVSTAKLRATGWEPKHTLLDGIHELVGYYQRDAA